MTYALDRVTALSLVSNSEFNKYINTDLPAVRNISCPSTAGFLDPETGACRKCTKAQ